MNENIDENKITIKDVAKYLGISVPTTKNWIKKQYIIFPFLKPQLKNLKNNIENGTFNVLQKGANKNNSKAITIPYEYINNVSVITSIKAILNISKEYFADIQDFIYNTTIAFLLIKQELNEYFGKYKYKRKIIEKLIIDFFENKTPNYKYIFEILSYLIKLEKNNCEDILGLLFQSFKNEGNKAQNGSYYTPIEISNILNANIKSKIEKYYDPCCGTGNFLLNIAKQKNIEIEKLYGSDIDSIAVFITKINLLCYYKNYNKEPNVFHSDFINDNIEIRPNVMVENPPWGAAKNTDKYKKFQKLISSKEIFSFFILKSLKQTKENGEIIFLLPKSILNIKIHNEIRKLIANETKIISITNFGKIFSNVFTDVIAIHVKNCKPNNNNNILINNKNNIFYTNQSIFVKNKYCIFNININYTDYKIIKKIYSIPHKTLKNNAIWALGIITGNNSEFISNEKTEKNERIIKGSDIQKYYVNKINSFIEFDTLKMQQFASLQIYRNKEKIVYRFINNELIFAYEDSSLLTLNSANIIIPTTLEYSQKSAIALLNSKLFQYLFKKLFSTHKILRNDLETLPFPIISDYNEKKLTYLVNEIILNKNPKITNINSNEIDSIVFSLFKLNDSEIKYILSQK